MGVAIEAGPVRRAAAAALNVTASVRGLVWRERLDPAGAGTALAMSQRYRLPELLSRVLAARGVGLDEVAVALDPTIKALMPDPSSLRDMDAAASRLADAIARRERVAVFGDYDVDGACSCAQMALFLAAHGLKPRIYIPDRMTEGYGPNVGAIEALAKDGATLILTLDCGTTSFEPLAAARRLGVDVVVVDHHQADERLPEVAALVNPNRQDDISGLGHLCAAGVVFMLLVATARELRRRGPATAAARAHRPAGAARSRGAGDGVRRGAAARPQPRLRGARPQGAAPAPQRRPQGAGRCGRARRSAHRLSPGLRAGAAHQRRRAHRRLRPRRAAAGAGRRDRGGAHRRAARQAQPRAQGARDGDAGGGDAAGRYVPGGASRYADPHRRLRGLPQGRGRPGGEPAGGALPSPRLRHRLGRAWPRHRLAALDCRRRHRRGGAGSGGRRATSSRAAATPWPRAFP